MPLMNLNQNNMDCKAIIFDLDGTLLDTLADLADAANCALVEGGFPTHDQQAYRWFVGDGSKRLITRALPESQRAEKIVNARLKAFIAEYQRSWNRATQPYAGVVELLDELALRHIRMAVVTNKPHRFTLEMMNHYFKAFPFDPILGQRDGIPKKPHPGQALAAASKMGVLPAHCIFLGDSGVDMETAHRAGMVPVGAGWGFRPSEELVEARAIRVIQRPLELLGLI
jgi:phosphoglycolate phosphatase